MSLHNNLEKIRMSATALLRFMFSFCFDLYGLSSIYKRNNVYYFFFWNSFVSILNKVMFIVVTSLDTIDVGIILTFSTLWASQ